MWINLPLKTVPGDLTEPGKVFIRYKPIVFTLLYILYMASLSFHLSKVYRHIQIARRLPES